MKLSTYHKSRGDNVTLIRPQEIATLDQTPSDIIYISCIFVENRDLAIELSRKFPNVLVGGSGIDLDNRLPPNIETLMPDYDLYPEMKYSLGFTTRGCIRSCDFCIVPKKEGTIQIVGDIYNFWNRKHKHVMLLDNNILALPSHFEQICNQIQIEKLTEPQYLSSITILIIS